MASLPEFNPEDATAKNIEDNSLLGPYLKLSAYPDSTVSYNWENDHLISYFLFYSQNKVAENYFQNAENRNSADLESCKNGLRGSVQNIQVRPFIRFINQYV